MLAKPKFNLTSIIVEDKLIYYKSINKIKKLIAFSLFSAYNLPRIILILNELLTKRILKSYSIQLKLSTRNRRTFILYFEDEEKEKILAAFNMIYEKIQENVIQFHFYQKKALKKKFFEILSNDISPMSNVILKNNTILIKSKNETKHIECFLIKLQFISNRFAFINTLLKILFNFNKFGFLIFNISINNYNEISFYTYYLDTSKDISKTNLNLEKEINSLFKLDIFERVEISLKKISKILWRKSLTNELFTTNFYLDFFMAFGIYDFDDLIIFSLQFERYLKLNNFEIHKLNHNLFLINQSIIVIIIEKLDLEIIEKVLAKYISSHRILLFILDNEIYDRLLKIEQINHIKNLNILNIEDIIKSDFINSF